MESYVVFSNPRGAVLACAVPWLRNLLLQHASGIMSQESSLLALNSLFQVRGGYFIVENVSNICTTEHQ